MVKDSTKACLPVPDVVPKVRDGKVPTPVILLTVVVLTVVPDVLDKVTSPCNWKLPSVAPAEARAKFMSTPVVLS